MLDYQSPARAFVDAPAETEFASERLARQIRLYDINARHRAERARSGRWVNVGIATLLAAILIGLITPQAVENWHNVKAENVQQ
jgi:hypothetical protein